MPYYREVTHKAENPRSVRLLTTNNPEALEAMINLAIENGWSLLNGVQVTGMPDHIMYVQMMAKYHPSSDLGPM